STITVSTGDAIHVNHVGNSVTGNAVSVIGEGDSRGVHAQGGGAITLTDSTVQTQDGAAVSASMAESLVIANSTHLSSAETAVLASDSGRIELTGGSVSGAGGEFGTLRAIDGGIITARDIEITSTHDLGVQVQSGGKVELLNVSVLPVGEADEVAVSVHDAEVVFNDVTAGRVDIRGSSLATIQGSTVRVIAVFDESSLSLVDSQLTGSGLLLGGFDTMSSAAATLTNVTFGSEATPSSPGIVMGGMNTVLVAQDVDIYAVRHAVDIRGGAAYFQGGMLRGLWGGLLARGDFSQPVTIEAVGTHIQAESAISVGVSVNRPGTHVSLDGVTVDVFGDAKLALQVTDGAHLNAANSQVYAQTDGSTGLQMRSNADSGATAVSLANTKVTMAGQGANAVDSVRYASQDANTLVVSGGSDLQTHDGVGFLVRGAHHEITVENSQVLARSGGNEAGGVLLHTQAAPAVETESVTLNALGAVMTGDVLADSGRVDVRLANGSAWTGAVLSGQGVVDSVSTEDSSVWNVRGNSALKTLKNAGFVQFVAPDAQTGFKTLTVSDYLGGGTLVMNTQLGDDTSLTDKLIIDGGAVTGSTGLRIMNAGGTGALTTQGIQLVQAVNGATIAADAFHLDAGSTGFRSTSSTLGWNGYEYFLVQGGAGGVASDWYLTSAYLPEEGGTTEPGGGETLPPGSGTETPPGSGSETPPGSGTETPPGSGTETPPGSGTETPPGSGT
ncbi:autotransporter outer membrane beta-barrel domain-containing protein, partial [Achromobacter mucicolens]|uniref:autotransporter outer membrane beta-barrel domain-containing protein n=1 Tax=Achromobacter mucicolens TaxID=1389922 RepID=UPI002447322B